MSSIVFEFQQPKKGTYYSRLTIVMTTMKKPFRETLKKNLMKTCNKIALYLLNCIAKHLNSIPKKGTYYNETSLTNSKSPKSINSFIYTTPETKTWLHFMWISCTLAFYVTKKRNIATTKGASIRARGVGTVFFRFHVVGLLCRQSTILQSFVQPKAFFCNARKTTNSLSTPLTESPSSNRTP